MKRTFVALTVALVAAGLGAPSPPARPRKKATPATPIASATQTHGRLFFMGSDGTPAVTAVSAREALSSLGPSMAGGIAAGSRDGTVASSRPSPSSSGACTAGTVR